MNSSIPEDKSSTDYIEDTSPPSGFYGGHLDTPKPPKGKLRSRTNLLNTFFNRGSAEGKNCDADIPEGMDTMEEAKVTFQMEVEAIPVAHSHYSENDDEEVDSTGDEDNDAEDEQEDEADRSADDEAESSSASSSSIGNMIKSFVFADVGPNLTDTVHELTHLLSDLATNRAPVAEE